MNWTASLLLLLRFVIALAPLEQEDGAGLYLGAWYDRLNGDTPSAINKRLNYKPLTFFQVDCNITDTLQVEPIDDLIRHVNETNTNAFLFLTVYPYEGFQQVSESAFQLLVSRIADIAKDGHQIMIRYASEMNGSWFRYGQQPTLYVSNWIKIVSAVRNATANLPGTVAFLWSPNDGSGYPYSGYGIVRILDSDVPTLDTNGDGRVALGDDPYTPYYPGDEWVDWVGMSIYHYSNQYPYGSNDIPSSTIFESKLIGDSVAGRFNIYEMFSGSGRGGQPVPKSRGGKPFFVSETGATVFLAVRDTRTNVWSQPNGTDPEYRTQIRQTWWRQFLQPNFLNKYPKLKGASFFEFMKYEDSEFRDFTTLGWSTNQTIPIFGGFAGENDTATVDALRRDLQGIYGQNILWGDSSRGNNGPNPTVPANPTKPSTLPKGSGLGLQTSLLAFFPLLFLI